MMKEIGPQEATAHAASHWAAAGPLLQQLVPGIDASSAYLVADVEIADELDSFDQAVIGAAGDARNALASTIQAELKQHESAVVIIEDFFQYCSEVDELHDDSFCFENRMYGYATDDGVSAISDLIARLDWSNYMNGVVVSGVRPTNLPAGGKPATPDEIAEVAAGTVQLAFVRALDGHGFVAVRPTIHA